MKQELYEELLKSAKSNGIVLADYGSIRGIPHYIWSCWKYMPDQFGENLLKEFLNRLRPNTEIREWLRKTRIYEMKPFVVDSIDNTVMFVGQGMFLGYSHTEKCFTVSRYPAGYDEIDRNCFPWGKMLKTLDATDGTAKIICSAMIWYSFYELAVNSDVAFISLQHDEENMYATLSDLVLRVTGFKMEEYSTMKISNFMSMRAAGVSEHIKLCGSRVYNISDKDGVVLARFCYNKSSIILEWKDGQTNLSVISELHIPGLVTEDGSIILYCIAGFLASNKIKVGWHSAYTWNNAVELTRLNARDVMVKSMEDVVC